jgi:hypothetical protein
MAEKEFTWDYDPVKQLKGGVEASKVVWSTKSLNAAVDALKKGLPLKANPFCGTNTMLLKPDIVYRRTEEEVEDYIKCMQDPLYFAEKCFLMTPKGLQAVKMRDYQIEYLKNLKENRFNILLACRQAGKSVTTAIFGLWKILFCNDRNGLILSKSGPAGRDLLKKVKDMYMYLPYHLKAGTMKWNQSEISFDNNSSLSTEAFGPTAALGKSLNLIILDEFAWCPANEVDLFYENVIPTVTTMPDSNVCICSTQNGFNKFYEIWESAIEGRSMYHHQKIDWWQVPNYNIETGQWEKRTEEWKQMMVGILGSEEAFYYQYGTQFSASDACLVSRETLTRIHQNEILFTSREDIMSSLYSKFFFVNPEYDIENFKNKYYIVLVDLAEGGGSDYTVFQILEVNVDPITGKATFEQVAFWRSNTVDIEKAAVEFWVMMGQLFRPDLSNVIVSVEWNTYGALFYNYICLLNEPENFKDSMWRFSICKEFDTSIICHYKKGNMNEEIAGLRNKNSKTIPGMRWSAESKKTGCAMLKMMLEKGELIIRDIIQIGELENFEDKNGSGSYKASYGHDDMMMTLVQLPMVVQTGKYKEFIEEISERQLLKTNDFNTGENLYGSMSEVMFTHFEPGQQPYSFSANTITGW